MLFQNSKQFMQYVEKCVNIYDVTCTQERNKSEVKLKCETSGSGADQCVLSTDLCYVRPWIICLKGRISSQHRRRSRHCVHCLKKSLGNIQPACLPPPSMCTLKIYFQKETSTFISQELFPNTPRLEFQGTYFPVQRICTDHLHAFLKHLEFPKT